MPRVDGVIDTRRERRRSGRRSPAWLAALLLLADAGGAAAASDASPRCPVPRAHDAYTAAVEHATRARRDVWGERLLATPGGPSYEAAARTLAPILYAQGRQRRPLTASGVYYVAFTLPRGPWGEFGYGLHVADGSEIHTRRIGGPRLMLTVGGARRERFGSCLGRLAQPRLAGGYLPILQTRYGDAAGVTYRQESFVGRLPGVRGLVSFVRLVADARRARAGGTVSLRASTGDRARGSRLVTPRGTRLVVSSGALFDRGAFRLRVSRGERRVLYALWLHGPSPARRARATGATYGSARAEVVRSWEARLAEGAAISVPEERVDQALRGVLIQQLGHVWRYSVGNPYEELSFAEALDTAEVLAAYGHRDVARAIVRLSLQRLPRRPNAWRAAEHLVAAATYYRLYRDRDFLRENDARLRRALAELEARQLPRGGCAGEFRPEQLCSDVSDTTHSVTSHLVAWQGLHAMARVWRDTGELALAVRAETVVRRLERAVRPRLERSLTRLDDGSVFVPIDLHGLPPHDRLMDTRAGSYWNLVVPYALASGWFRPGGADADGIVRYLLRHGSRLLGVTRADAHVVYGPHVVGASGLGQVYGLNVSRFLADNDRSDELVLSLYGMLGIAMTPGTYVSGEAITVTPRGRVYHRSMYLPPNAGANSTFLETLRLVLVHERRGRHGEPVGLDLAHATPRRWLAPGRTIRVDRAPTSFGPVTFTLERRPRTVHGRLVLPARAGDVRLRLRLPHGDRLHRVVVNGRTVGIDATGAVDLRGLRGTVELWGRLGATAAPRALERARTA
jgi:hypothetical protein